MIPCLCEENIRISNRLCERCLKVQRKEKGERANYVERGREGTSDFSTQGKHFSYKTDSEIGI